MSWLWAFLFTQAVEVPIYVVGARTRPDEGFCASAITHPIVWFVFPWAFDSLFARFGGATSAFFETPRIGDGWSLHYIVMVVFAEAFAVVVEGFYLRWLKKPAPFRWSLVANASSVALGLLSRYLFGIP